MFSLFLKLPEGKVPDPNGPHKSTSQTKKGMPVCRQFRHSVCRYPCRRCAYVHRFRIFTINIVPFRNYLNVAGFFDFQVCLWATLPYV